MFQVYGQRTSVIVTLAEGAGGGAERGSSAAK